METNVTGVSGTNITAQITTHYSNGTEKTQGGWIDVETGAYENLTIWFISANLGVNDMIYNSTSYSTITINSTVLQTYESGVRETNCLNVTYFSKVNADRLFWKHVVVLGQINRVLVEFSLDYINRTGADTTTFAAHIGITDANVWLVPEFPTWGLTLLILTSTTSAVLIVCKKRLRVHKA